MKTKVIFAILTVVSFNFYGQKDVNQPSKVKSLKNLYRFSNFNAKSEIKTAVQKLDSMLYYKIDSTQQAYVTEKEIYLYDENGNLILDFYYRYEDSSYVPYDKTEYTYDNAGNKISEIYYDWDDSTAIWVFNNKTEYLYNNGLLEEEKGYYWDANNYEWVMNDKSIYTYNNGLLSEKLNLSYNIYTTEWDTSGKVIYNYDTNDLLTEEAHYYWINNQWVNNYKDEYTYNSNGKIISDIYYEWQDTAWVYSNKTEYSYDNNDNVTEVINYDWDVDQWEGSDKYELTYDLNISASDLFLPDFLEDFSQNKILSADVYSYESNNWVYNFKVELYYSPVAIVFTHTINNVKIYPNPSTGKIFVKLPVAQKAVMEIYDMDGKNVFKRNLHGTSSVSIKDLPSGTYIYKIKSKEYNKTGKLIKR